MCTVIGVYASWVWEWKICCIRWNYIVIKVYRFYSLSCMVYHKSLQNCNSLDCCTVWKGMYKNQINECLKAASWVWFPYLPTGEEVCRNRKDHSTSEVAQHGAELALFWGVICKRAKIWGGCFGHLKFQNGTAVFHIEPSHGLIWPQYKGRFSRQNWYWNGPISVRLNWP